MNSNVIDITKYKTLALEHFNRFVFDYICTKPINNMDDLEQIYFDIILSYLFYAVKSFFSFYLISINSGIT